MQLVTGLAGEGNAEFISDDEAVDDKVMVQLGRALSPVWSDVTACFHGNASINFNKSVSNVSMSDRFSLFVGFENLKVRKN